MAAAGGSPEDFAALFERITGESTLVQHQRADPPERLDDGEAIEVGEAVATVVRETGFEDVIDDPEPD